jgi:UDP-N-acetylglucosamine:LPS N-acetylglucosamine transferase
MECALAEVDFRKKILIIYIAAGSGHTTYSRAIRAGLERLFPGMYNIREMDYVQEIGPVSFDKSSKNVWAFMLRHPNVGRFTDAFVEKCPPLARAIELVWSQEHIRNSVRFIREYRPDIIIAPHPQTLRVAVITKRKLGLKIPVIGIDIEPFSGGVVYAHPGADRIVVFSDQAKAMLMKRGVPENKLAISDFLLDPKFLKPYDSVESTRRSYGLEPGILTLLMSSGGDGIGNLEKYIKATVAHDLPVQLAVMTGRNAALKDKLESTALPPGSKTVLKIFGFVENFNDLIHASDVVFGKGGACTTIESLYMRKPVIYYRCVTGNEKRSVDFVRKNGLGWSMRTTRGYLKIVRGLLQSSDALDRIQENYDRFDFKSGAETFCGLVAEALGAGEKDWRSDEKQDYSPYRMEAGQMPVGHELRGSGARPA